LARLVEPHVRVEMEERMPLRHRPSHSSFRHARPGVALACLAALALAACATPTMYGPADANGYGYREQRIESDRFIVTFRGNTATPADAVGDAALRRAAELTLQEGYDWFEVVSNSTNLDPSYGRSGSGVSVGVGGVSGSRGSSVGTSVGMSFPLGGGSGGSATTSLEVRMGHGERPDRPSAYDAREVSRNLAAAAAAP
jgi:hypothetical protein